MSEENNVTTPEKEFKPIESQEAFDAAVKKRIERERAKFADYDDLKRQIAAYESKIAESTKQSERIAELEKAVSDREASIAAKELDNLKVFAAVNAGLPISMAGRLAGSTAEELKADAESLAQMLVSKTPAPLRNPEAQQAEDGVLAAFRKLNPGLKV